ncbi:MAG: DUF4864 domain-containing protein [Nitrospirae bacterium]|nr:DUF4864 domain-containing protein [Nitrospirota bacterium]
MRTVVVVVLLGGVFWWFWGRTLEPVRVIRAQLQAINQGQYDQAYNYLSTDAQSRVSMQEFQALAQGNSRIMRTYDSTFLSRKIENNVATIGGSLKGEDGQVSEVQYVLVKSGGQWMIQSFKW